MADEVTRTIDLPDAHRKQVLEIIRARLPDATIWVYGSRAKGRARRYSDLDLMLDDRGKTISGSVLGNLDEDFDESDLPIIVELRDMAEIDAAFLARVRKDFLLLE